MTSIQTGWVGDTKRPARIVESHMVLAGGSVRFELAGVEVSNRGDREAGLFLRADGEVVADVPIGIALMSKRDADWVAAHVLTKRYLDSSGGVDLVRLCECQYGRCGHCGMGNHSKCTTRVGFNGQPNQAPHTHIVARDGAALTQVWPKGKPCRWVCPCPECPTSGKPEPVAYRKARGGLRPGDTVWLTPKTLTAPAICWTQPRATVIDIERTRTHLIVKVGHDEYRVHVDNIRRTEPIEARPKPKQRRMEMAEGYTEQTLF